MSAALTCPNCQAQAMTQRDKFLWMESSRAIPCANCGQRLSLSQWRSLAFALPILVLVLMLIAGAISVLVFVPCLAIAIAAAQAQKVYLQRLVPARKHLWLAKPWLYGQRPMPPPEPK